jgi:hypothetical protein
MENEYKDNSFIRNKELNTNVAIFDKNKELDVNYMLIIIFTVLNSIFIIFIFYNYNKLLDFFKKLENKDNYINNNNENKLMLMLIIYNIFTIVINFSYYFSYRNFCLNYNENLEIEYFNKLIIIEKNLIDNNNKIYNLENEIKNIVNYINNNDLEINTYNEYIYKRNNLFNKIYELDKLQNNIIYNEYEFLLSNINITGGYLHFSLINYVIQAFNTLFGIVCIIIILIINLKKYFKN